MSRFYGSLVGSRGDATRQGTAKSGIRSHTRGWQVGARVNCFVGDNGNDQVAINITGGSSNPQVVQSLGTYELRDGELHKVDS